MNVCVTLFSIGYYVKFKDFVFFFELFNDECFHVRHCMIYVNKAYFTYLFWFGLFFFFFLPVSFE